MIHVLSFPLYVFFFFYLKYVGISMYARFLIHFILSCIILVDCLNIGYVCS